MQKGVGRSPEPMFKDMRHVRPASLINAIGEFSNVVCPHYGVADIGRQNGLYEPVIDPAGN